MLLEQHSLGIYFPGSQLGRSRTRYRADQHKEGLGGLGVAVLGLSLQPWAYISNHLQPLAALPES
jgi:hypothetical protein